MAKLEGWAKDLKVQEWKKTQKTRIRVYIQSGCCIILGVILYLVGWWMIGLSQFLIALGIPLVLFGSTSFYGQAVSEISIDSNGRNQSPGKN